MIKSNYQHIQKLSKIIKNGSLRHEIIFYDTLIGSYQARKKNPDNFQRPKQITGQVIESEQIAIQRENTLKLIEKNSVKKIYEKLLKKLTKF